MKKQAGFTLIELIVVIVILGILAATALPRFVNFGAQASNASAAGVAGAMASGASINVANRSLNVANGVAVNDTAANICANGNALWGVAAGGLLQGGLPAGYTLSVSPANTVAGTCVANDVVICRVTENTQGGVANAAIACIL